MSKIFEPSLSTRQAVASSLLAAACLRGNSAHAYLLAGRGTADKWLLANQLACHLNCTDPDRDRLGSCRLRELIAAGSRLCQNCEWISRDKHPQAYIVLTGEGKTGKVPVEKSRALAGELAKTSQFMRVVVVPEADEQSFHRPAANALLKTIEEPGQRCLFFLFAAHQEDVLPTIVSRCQVVPVLKAGKAGFWGPDVQPADPEEQAREFDTARQTIERMPTAYQNQKVQPASPAATLEWVHQLVELESDNLSPALIVDLIAARETERLRAQAADQDDVSSYLKRVLELAETTKEQIEHYVPVRPALEAFAIGLRSLSHKDRRLSP